MNCIVKTKFTKRMKDLKLVQNKSCERQMLLVNKQLLINQQQLVVVQLMLELKLVGMLEPKLGHMLVLMHVHMLVQLHDHKELNKNKKITPDSFWISKATYRQQDLGC